MNIGRNRRKSLSVCRSARKYISNTNTHKGSNFCDLTAETRLEPLQSRIQSIHPWSVITDDKLITVKWMLIIAQQEDPIFLYKDRLNSPRMGGEKACNKDCYNSWLPRHCLQHLLWSTLEAYNHWSFPDLSVIRETIFFYEILNTKNTKKCENKLEIDTPNYLLWIQINSYSTIIRNLLLFYRFWFRKCTKNWNDFKSWTTPVNSPWLKTENVRRELKRGYGNGKEEGFTIPFRPPLRAPNFRSNPLGRDNWPYFYP